MVDVGKTGQDTDAAGSDRSTATLIRQLTDQVSTLVRDEMQVARLELQRKGRRIGAGAGALTSAGALAFYGGGALVATAILAIAQVLRPWLAGLVVGAALLVLAGLLALIGRSQVKRATPPVPEQAVTGVTEDLNTIREGMRR